MDRPTPKEEESDLGQTIQGLVAGTQLFHRYTLQKVLGRGAVGIVWLAYDDRLDRLVALKLLPESVCSDPAAREDFKRQARESLLLTHPNIVRIFDFIEDEQLAAICMEYVDGTTLSLARWQKRSKCFGIPELIPWVTSLCDALAYAHETVGLVHRSLNPANIMVDSRSHLKITDFGIACGPHDPTNKGSAGASSGTMNYMSPQQILGEDPCASDDIYALGAILYEMLSSKPPFYTGDVALQAREVIAPPISQRRVTLGIAGERIPKHWEETIAACLAKQPEQRPRSAADVASRLRLGGTIHLTAARDIAKPIFQRYLKLAALTGASVALLSAVVISSRWNSASQRTAVLSELKQETSTGYGLEAPVRNVPVPKTDDPPAESVSSSTTGPQGTTLELATAPAGTSFAIYPGVIEGKAAPATVPIRRGVAPQSVTNLPPGRYTVFFHNPVWPDDCAEIALQPGETLPVEYTFPHGTVMISSIPEGAEIFAGETSLGRTPLTINLPLGKQELVARHPDFPKRTETVTIDGETPAKLVFQLQTSSHSAAKSKEPESVWRKFGKSLKKAFSSKPPNKKRNP